MSISRIPSPLSRRTHTGDMSVSISDRVIEILGQQIASLVIDNAQAKAFLGRSIELSKDVNPIGWVCHNGAVLVPEQEAAALREMIGLLRPVV